MRETEVSCVMEAKCGEWKGREGEGRGGKRNEEEDYEMRECELLIAFASERQEERQLTSAKR